MENQEINFMNVVIIGAGKTGRGYVAPIFYENGFDITFLDDDENLIKKLNIEKKYKVSYFDNDETKEINCYKAFSINDKKALEEIKKADIITTSVFSNNLIKVSDFLSKSLIDVRKKPFIICIENGINVKKPLLDKKIKATICEGIIFCTTIQKENSLDLVSEYKITLPIDAKSCPKNFSLKGVYLEKDFKSLIQRKIYTYNFLSALICYFGYYLNYEVYSKASKDLVINKLINIIKKDLNIKISKKYKISLLKQTRFFNKALKKFQNEKIFDTVKRNAQQARRKLQKEERVLTPILLEKNIEKTSFVYLLLAAACLYYATKQEHENYNVLCQELFENIKNKNVVSQILIFYESLNRNKNLNEIIKENT